VIKYSKMDGEHPMYTSSIMGRVGPESCMHLKDGLGIALRL
jgi:hypothetical protein